MTAPLAGVRVIDLGTRIAAPFCAGLLGEQGAEVIKVEQPRGGDFMREIGPFVDTDDGPYSLFWAVEGRGRKSVTLDLRTARRSGAVPPPRGVGRRRGRELPARARSSSGTSDPTACDPRLVTVRISMFGQDGPNAGRARASTGSASATAGCCTSPAIPIARPCGSA